MLQIFAIILFSNSLILFSQFSAIVIHSLVPKLEQGTLEVDVDMLTLIHHAATRSEVIDTIIES